MGEATIIGVGFSKSVFLLQGAADGSIIDRGRRDASHHIMKINSLGPETVGAGFLSLRQ
ncbi:hypothetical protein SAMN02982931_04737, partial [Bauldia litoralis]